MKRLDENEEGEIGKDPDSVYEFKRTPTLKNEPQTSKPSLCSIKQRLKVRNRIPPVD